MRLREKEIRPPVSQEPAASSAGPAAAAQAAELESLRRRVRDLEAQLRVAETRASEAEKALHELAGRRAIENVNTGRRLAEMETLVAGLQSMREQIAAETRADLEATEKRSLDLRHRLSKLSVSS